MNNQRYAHIEAMLDIVGELPDAAFLAAIEEQGIDMDDLDEFTDETRRREKQGKQRKPPPTKKRRRA